MRSCRSFKWQIRIITLIFIVNIIISIPIIFQIDLHHEQIYSNRTDCFFTSLPKAKSLVLMEILTDNIIPFSIVSTFNFLMIRSLYHARNRITSQKFCSKIQARDLKFSLSTLFFNFIYIGLKLPMAVYHYLMVINIFGEVRLVPHYDDQIRLAVNLYCSTCGLTFFIYFTFYRIFRKEFLLMVRFR